MAKTVIAIEDDPQIAELIRVLLSSDDVSTVHYSDGPRGLAGVMEIKPDLILLDIMVPGLNGWEVFDTIRATDAVKHIPIIILSVVTQSFERRVDFSQSTIDFYVSKPFDVLSLRNRVDELLKGASWHVGNEMPEPRLGKPPIKPITNRLMTQTERLKALQEKTIKRSTSQLKATTVKNAAGATKENGSPSASADASTPSALVKNSVGSAAAATAVKNAASVTKENGTSSAPPAASTPSVATPSASEANKTPSPDTDSNADTSAG